MSRGTVIVVPGFLGNELTVPHRFRDAPLTVWMSMPAMASFGFEALALPLPDRPGIPRAGQEVNVGPTLEGPYRELIQYLQVREWEVYPMQFDWRRPIAHSAAVLYDRIIRDPTEWPLHIVAHSRGGLVTRRMLGMLTADQRPVMIGRVIGVGVPHTGAMQAVATLGDASDFLRNLKRVTQALRPFQYFTVSSNRVETCLRSWPALYELLPDPARAGLSAGLSAAIYSAQSYADDGMAIYPPHLTAAQTAWAAIPDVYPSVEWVDVAGVGVDTLAGVTAPIDLTHRRGFVLDDGDGTVHVNGALKPNRVKITVPCAHDALLRDGRLLPHIHQALLSMPVFDVVLKGRVAY